jgi:hypothetical protein
MSKVKLFSPPEVTSASKGVSAEVVYCAGINPAFSAELDPLP